MSSSFPEPGDKTPTEHASAADREMFNDDEPNLREGDHAPRYYASAADQTDLDRLRLWMNGAPAFDINSLPELPAIPGMA